MLKIMYSGPSFVIFGLEEINSASLQEILVALAENSPYQYRSDTICASEEQV